MPDGWTGKLWAVAQGVRQSRPDYYLLTDADIVHPPANVAALVARAAAGGYDLVSYMATLRCETAAERALVPAFVFFFFMLYPPSWIRSPRRRTAGAAGGCMLVRRDALERIGGIERIRGELIDDCALARAIKRSGGRVWLGLSTGTRSIRPYETFGEIERMISRTAFTQLRYSTLLLLATLAGLALTYLAPPALALTGSWYGAAAWTHDGRFLYPGAAVLPEILAVGARAAANRRVLLGRYRALGGGLLAGLRRHVEGTPAGLSAGEPCIHLGVPVSLCE